jgi:hypothetical protein
MGCLGVSLNSLFVNFKNEIALNLLFIVFLDYFNVLISKVNLKNKIKNTLKIKIITSF